MQAKEFPVEKNQHLLRSLPPEKVVESVQEHFYNEKSASYNKPQPPPRRADQILYGLDPQGKPVYMDAADVAELLGTPKAKKVKQ